MSNPDAFLVYQGTLYQPSVPFFMLGFISPVCALVEGIWLNQPELARAILRERIFTNYSLSPACEGMIKLAAKRVTALSESNYQEMKCNYTAQTVIQDCIPRITSPFLEGALIGRLVKDDQIPELLFGLKEQVVIQAEKFNSSRPVAALLLDSENRILSYAYNMNSTFKIQHAEHELLRAYFLRERKKIPVGSSLWVTLKPCCMCAGAIMDSSENVESLSIRYLENDPGPKAANSCFVPGSDLWIKCGSPLVSMKIV